MLLLINAAGLSENLLMDDIEVKLLTILKSKSYDEPSRNQLNRVKVKGRCHLQSWLKQLIL